MISGTLRLPYRPLNRFTHVKDLLEGWRGLQLGVAWRDGIYRDRLHNGLDRRIYLRDDCRLGRPAV
jgi:hypothetical protein